MDNEKQLIKASSIFQKFAMCYNNHRQHKCEYCNCENCDLSITDEEFDLMMEHIKILQSEK